MFNLIPGLFTISLFVLVSVAGLVMVQHFVPTEVRKRHNDVAGFIYAVVGIAYAVLLGLMVVAVWEQYQMARSPAEREASDDQDPGPAPHLYSSRRSFPTTGWTCETRRSFPGRTAGGQRAQAPVPGTPSLPFVLPHT